MTEPAGRSFFDTNVFLYLLSTDDAKADRAEAVIAGGGVISVQVLNEIAAVGRRKLKLSWEEIDDILGLVRRLCPAEPLTVAVHERGRELARRHGLSIYDAMIVAAALEAGCGTLYSEDMQHGRVIDGQLTILNPFA